MKEAIPDTMRAAQVHGYGGIQEMISVEDAVPVPSVGKGEMLLRTQTVSVAPGDVRVLSGRTREVQGPKVLPYVPCADCCGIVVDIADHTKDLPFQVGDRVAVRFHGRNFDSLADFALVSTTVAAKVPENLSSAEAAALASASPAASLAEYVQKGDRVLIIGAGGGVGAHLCQLVRLQGATMVAGVGSRPERLLSPPISCDAAIDYRDKDAYDPKNFSEKFDIVFDLVGGGYQEFERRVKGDLPLNIKAKVDGGRFVTTVPFVGPDFDIHGILDGLKIFVFPILFKYIMSRIFSTSKLPSYSMAIAIPDTRSKLEETLEMASSGKLKAVIDPLGPFSFSQKGVCDAYSLQESRHPHGKVLVQVSE